ncbi:hypothetical protein [Microcystis sp. LE19-59.1C]|uniref:hypothetical protein n=1 Tax=Microcystis sp. LE19-59.1C TaxID=3016442 RepID=UPI0025902963|nr:hypothetical protein [Microcystis sp. LE19-59.1C]
MNIVVQMLEPPSPHHPVTPSPHHPTSPSPHHPITPHPRHPTPHTLFLTLLPYDQDRLTFVKESELWL